MELAPLLVGAGGFVTAAIALYRARSDKAAVLVDTAVKAARGLAETSTLLVEPLRADLIAARERLSVVEEHARNCDEKLDVATDKLDTLTLRFESLETTVKKVNGV